MLVATQSRNKIQDLLASKNWSIYELSSRTGISYPQLYRLVKAESIPAGTTLATLKKLAQAFGVRIEDLED
jgi:DNA-binding Xre family transcriptional regulator